MKQQWELNLEGKGKHVFGHLDVLKIPQRVIDVFKQETRVPISFFLLKHALRVAQGTC